MKIVKDKLILGPWMGETKIWDLNHVEKKPRILSGHRGEIRCIKNVNDTLISGSSDRLGNGEIKIWDLKSGQKLGEFSVSNGFSCIHVVKGKIITGSFDGTIRIWDFKTGQELQKLNGHQNGIKCIKSVEDKFIISGAEDGTIKVWDLNTGTELRTLIGHRGCIRCLKILDNKFIISASMDNTIKVWDLNTGKQLQDLVGDQGGITCLKILDKFIISGSWTGAIKIWDLNTGKQLQEFFENEFLEEGQCISRIKIVEGRFFSIQIDGTLEIRDFDVEENPKSFKKLTQAESRQNPLEVVLNIATKEDYSQQLKCTPDFLPKIGICSLADLKIICDYNSHDFDRLQVTNGIAANDYVQLQTTAFKKKEAVVELVDQLWNVANQKSQKATEQCSVIRDENGIVKEARNPWIAFQKELESFQEDLSKKTQTRQALLSMFSEKSYSKLVEEANALIDKFHALEKKTLRMRLYPYVNQWGILGKWNHLRQQGITSLSAFFQQDKVILPQDIFNMGE